MSTNGLISFGREVTASNAELFPSSSNVVSQSYILAPFWADFDTTSDGSVLWWIDSIYVDFISEFIQEEYGDAAFSATWMLIATWSVQVSLGVVEVFLHTTIFFVCRETLSKLYLQQMVYQSLMQSIHTHVGTWTGLM